MQKIAEIKNIPYFLPVVYIYDLLSLQYNDKSCLDRSSVHFAYRYVYFRRWFDLAWYS